MAAGGDTRLAPSALGELGEWAPSERNCEQKSISDCTIWEPNHQMFEVSDVREAANDKYNITFGRGGFQGARGNKNGAEWFVSNVQAELDSPNEYYHLHSASASQLFFFPNRTVPQAAAPAPPPSDGFVAVTTKTILSVVGTKDAPVRDVTVDGVGFRDSAPTYMDPHGVPSGGDWALQRSGAIFLENTTNFVLTKSDLERLDGNALMISGFNSNTSVRGCHFRWIGDTAIACWGKTDELGDGGRAGIDATDGNFPIDTVIDSNIIREVGMWEKQSSMYFHGKAARTVGGRSHMLRPVSLLTCERPITRTSHAT